MDLGSLLPDCLTVSILHFTGAKVVMTTGDIKCAKLQSNCHQQQTNTQIFTGQMPFLSPN